MALLSGAGADPAAVDANAYNYAQTFGSGSAVEAIPNEYDLRVRESVISIHEKAKFILTCTLFAIR